MEMARFQRLNIVCPLVPISVVQIRTMTRRLAAKSLHLATLSWSRCGIQRSAANKRTIGRGLIRFSTKAFTPLSD